MQRIFEYVLLAALITSFYFLGNDALIYFRHTFPDIDRGIGVSLTAFSLIIFSLAVSFVLSFVAYRISQLFRR